MSSFGGGHVRAEGRDSLLLVLHAPACLGRLDVCLLARLTRSLGNSRVSSDHGPTPSSILSIPPTALLCRIRRWLYALSTQARRPWLYFLVFSARLPCFLSAYLLGGLDSTPALTWTHVFAPSNFRNDIARALKTDMIWRFSLPTGASLTWLGVLA
jgi:hypothetical protein